jgi:uncharacterized membrane protein YdjX (TVP38/TMEM64 family)
MMPEDGSKSSPEKGPSEAGEGGKKASFSFVRLLPVLLIFGIIAAFFSSGAHELANFQALKTYRHVLLGYVADYGLLALAAYVFIYMLVVSCSLPGGLVLTVCGGFLFGTMAGGFCAVIGATIGATIIFLAARTALGEALRQRAGPAMRKMEAGFRENALSYLLILRLIPLFPFFLVNLVPAFLGVTLRVYLIATFFGILPATFVFASLGNGLGAIFDAGKEPDAGIIFQPEIIGPIIGLALLALAPVVYKKWRAAKAVAE